MEIKTKDNRMLISQKKMIQGLINDYKISDIEDTPMETNLRWKGKSRPLHDIRKLQKLIGELSYLAISTRPDISFSVNFIARTVSDPRLEHLRAAKKVLKYLAGTIDHVLEYKAFSGSHPEVVVYTDSSFADDEETSRSTAGFLVYVNDCLINWAAKRLKLVVTSTAAAEYLAAGTGLLEGLFIANVLEEMFNQKVFPIKLFMDNTSAKTVLEGGKPKDFTKYMGSRLQQLRQFAKLGFVKIYFIKSGINKADGLTKSLARHKFKEFRDYVLTLDGTTAEEC